METCIVCSTEFTKKAWNQIYCSKECRRKGGLRQVQKKCPNCKNSFLTARSGSNSRKFCSRNCMASSYSTKIKKQELIDLYINHRWTTREIAKHYGVSKTTIIRALKRNDIPRRTAIESRMHVGYEKPSKEVLYKHYWDEWLSYEQIAEVYKVDTSSVYTWVKEYGIETRINAETRLGKDFIEPTKEQLHDLYVRKQLTLVEIGEILGCGEGVVSRRLTSVGIEVRSNLYGNAEYKICTNGLKVRSNYERYFANLLIKNNIGFDYEPRLPFDKKLASDFLIDDVYVEIWGVEGNERYEKQRIRKTKLYKKHDLKLLEIYPKDFGNIHRKIDKLKHLIN